MSDDKDDKKEFKIEFAPGCFDDFEGTQEELDELMTEIMAGLADGSLLEESRSIDDVDELPEEVLEKLSRFFDDREDRNKKLN
jgi:hypothetical protein